jgi:hypothetical protein
MMNIIPKELPEFSTEGIFDESNPCRFPRNLSSGYFSLSSSRINIIAQTGLKSSYCRLFLLSEADTAYDHIPVRYYSYRVRVLLVRKLPGTVAGVVASYM